MLWKKSSGIFLVLSRCQYVKRLLSHHFPLALVWSLVFAIIYFWDFAFRGLKPTLEWSSNILILNFRIFLRCHFHLNTVVDWNIMTVLKQKQGTVLLKLLPEPKSCGRQTLKRLFLKTLFHKFYLVHSWVLCPIYSLESNVIILFNLHFTNNSWS